MTISINQSTIDLLTQDNMQSTIDLLTQDNKTENQQDLLRDKLKELAAKKFCQPEDKILIQKLTNAVEVDLKQYRNFHLHKKSPGSSDNTEKSPPPNNDLQPKENPQKLDKNPEALAILNSLFFEEIPNISQGEKTNSCDPVDLWICFEEWIGQTLEKEEIQIPTIQSPLLVPKILVNKLSSHIPQPFSLSFSENRVIQFSDCSISLDPITQEFLCLESKFFKKLWQGTFQESAKDQITNLPNLSFEEFKNVLCFCFTTINFSTFNLSKETIINFLRRCFNLSEILSFLELGACKRECLLDIKVILFFFLKEPDLEASRTVKEIWESSNQLLYPFPSITHTCERFLNQQLEKFIEADSESCLEMAKLCADIPIKKIVIKSKNFVGNSLKNLPLVTSIEEVTLEESPKFQEANLVHLATLPLKTLKLIKCEQFEDASFIKSLAQLEKLNIEACRSFTGEGLSDLHILSIKEVNFNKCINLTDEGIKALSQWPLLEKLELEGCKAITGKGLSNLLKS